MVWQIRKELATIRNICTSLLLCISRLISFIQKNTFDSQIQQRWMRRYMAKCSFQSHLFTAKMYERWWSVYACVLCASICEKAIWRCVCVCCVRCSLLCSHKTKKYCIFACVLAFGSSSQHIYSTLFSFFFFTRFVSIVISANKIQFGCGKNAHTRYAFVGKGKKKKILQ